MTAIISRVQGAALCNPPTLWNTARLCELAIKEGIPGDFVECGVFAGSHPAIMADTIARLEPDGPRRVHLFDSFVGIPEAGPNDDESITGCIGPSKLGRLISSGVSACSVAGVKANMKSWGIDQKRLVFHEGWFQDTVPAAAPGMGRSGNWPIAVLRLDGDLYESTMVCLKYLHPLVSEFGWVIIDDYALTGCRKAVDEYLESMGLKRRMVPVDGGAGVVYYQR